MPQPSNLDRIVQYVALSREERIAALTYLNDDNDQLPENPHAELAREFLQAAVANSIGRGLLPSQNAEEISDGTGEEIGLISTCLSEVFGFRDLILQEKARYLALSADRVYLCSRSFIDIRPVFTNSDSGPELSTVVVLHELRVEVRENDQEKEYSFRMELSDIEELIRVLEYARTKHQALTRSFE